jgi:hypothetical protein
MSPSERANAGEAVMVNEEKNILRILSELLLPLDKSAGTAQEVLG